MRAPHVDRLLLVGAAAVLIQATIALAVDAGRQSTDPHWARERDTFTLDLGENLTGDWDKYLRRAAEQWDRSDVVNLRIVRGGSNPKSCQATDGRVEVCSARYGSTQWLGVTTVWTERGHIVQAVVKMNDTYFNDREYDDPVARRHTMCHELAHALGLYPGNNHPDHRTCVNDSEEAIFNFDKPAARDFRLLERLYRHHDDHTTVDRIFGGFSAAESVQPEPGRDKVGTKVIRENLGNDRERITYVDWIA